MVVNFRGTASNALLLIISAAYLTQQLIPDLQSQLLLPGLDYLQYTNEWYRLITVALTHGGLMHLGFNMYSLYILGTPIEQAYGRNKFLLVFAISLLTGSLPRGSVLAREVSADDEDVLEALRPEILSELSDTDRV
jgi:membrane associated rhomboid family serine protease